jgi:hexokinase
LFARDHELNVGVGRGWAAVRMRLTRDGSGMGAALLAAASTKLAK